MYSLLLGIKRDENFFLFTSTLWPRNATSAFLLTRFRLNSQSLVAHKVYTLKPRRDINLTLPRSKISPVSNTFSYNFSSLWLSKNPRFSTNHRTKREMCSPPASNFWNFFNRPFTPSTRIITNIIIIRNFSLASSHLADLNRVIVRCKHRTIENWKQSKILKIKELLMPSEALLQCGCCLHLFDFLGK